MARVTVSWVRGPRTKSLRSLRVAFPEAHEARGLRLVWLDQQKRRGGEKFCERRVFIDELEVAGDQMIVCRGNHHDLVNGNVLAPDDGEHLKCCNGEQDGAYQLRPMHPNPMVRSSERTTRLDQNQRSAR